jgi:hypothetical protein
VLYFKEIVPVDIALILQIKKGMWLNRRYKTLMHYFKGYKIEKNDKWEFTVLRVQITGNEYLYGCENTDFDIWAFEKVKSRRW